MPIRSTSSAGVRTSTRAITQQGIIRIEDIPEPNSQKFIRKLTASNMFTLKPFQETAVAHLKEKFLTLWKLGDFNLNLTFKSPTGSGKTIM